MTPKKAVREVGKQAAGKASGGKHPLEGAAAHPGAAGAGGAPIPTVHRAVKAVDIAQLMLPGGQQQPVQPTSGKGLEKPVMT